ncbi:GH-E family nuclease [Microbacterium aurum]
MSRPSASRAVTASRWSGTEQLLDEHNDPSRYRPESPSTSSGHRHELVS